MVGGGPGGGKGGLGGEHVRFLGVVGGVFGAVSQSNALPAGVLSRPAGEDPASQPGPRRGAAGTGRGFVPRRAGQALGKREQAG